MAWNWALTDDQWSPIVDVIIGEPMGTNSYGGNILLSYLFYYCFSNSIWYLALWMVINTN
jgi:hypothetical protein